MSLANPRRRTPANRLRGETEEGSSPTKVSMTLRKGATFHSPASSSTKGTFVPPCLPRSQTHLDDVVDANRRRIALTLNDIDEALAMTRDLSLSPKSPSSKSLKDDSLPVPRGLLDLPANDATMGKDDAATERRVLRPRSARQSRNHASDSGIGSSLSSVKDKAVSTGATDKKTKSAVNAAAITRSAAAANMEEVPALGQKTTNRIQEHTLGPLLEAKRLKDFHPIVLEVPRRIRSKEIICLRDLEKTLVFMAPERAKSTSMYLDFCLTSIRCIQATVEYVTEREQIRPGDRPYTNGYFIDLKEQIIEYARELAAAKDEGGITPMDVDQSDEVRLYGGIAENGRPVELVRITKDGTAISLATGKPVDQDDLPATIKRSSSEVRDDEEEIMRSMARRKKNPTPEELAPKRCREPGCTKEFKRPCDLTKHEKTHSRPWKCPIPTCKYHEFGWPTEKEMGRHLNDKHSDAPSMYECLFKPCPYKSKRESNCKQHMEKAHGWTYVRTKTPANKKLPSMPGSVQQQTPPLGSVSTPSTTPAYSVPTPPQDNLMPVATTDFPSYPPHEDWMAQFNLRSDWDTDLLMENTSPSSATSYEHVPAYQNGSAFILNDEDIYAARAHIPHQALNPEQLACNLKMMPQPPPMQTYQAPACPPAHTNAPHFSPSGQQNAMLFTPNSLREVDEAFDDSFATADGDDFLLYQPNVNMSKANDLSLFPEMPSADMGLSQQTQPDFFQQLDWNVNFNGLQE